MHQSLSSKSVVVVALLVLGACGEDVLKSNFSDTSETYEYEMNLGHCTTKRQKFQSRAAYCEGLANHELNRFCAAAERKQRFEAAKCSGVFPPMEGGPGPAPGPGPIPPGPGPIPGPGPTPTDRRNPEKLKITGKYEAKLTPIVTGKVMSEILEVSAKDLKYSEALQGQLDTLKAKKKELVSPTMEKCKDFFTDAFLINSGGKILFQKTLVGDIADDNRRACSLLLFAIKNGGMHLRLSDVPVVNGGRGTVPTVDLVLE